MLRWVENVRRIGGSDIRAVDLPALKTNLVRAGNLSLGRALERLPVTHLPLTREVRVGRVRGAELVNDFRSGELNRALAKSGSDRRVVRAVEQDAKKLFGRSIPEVQLRQLEVAGTQIKTSRPDLNVALRTPADFDRLPAATKQQVQAAIEKKFNWRSTTARYAIAFTLIVGGASFASVLVDAIARRNGCWLVTTNEGKASFCKISRQSCGQENDPTKKCSETQITNTAGNLFAFVTWAYGRPDQVARIEAATGERIDFTNLEAYVQKHVQELGPLVPTGFDFSKIPNPCINVATQKRYPDGCVMCDSSAAVGSRQYVDTTNLPTNVTYRCIQNSTLADILGDIGADIGSSISGLVSNVTKYLWWAAGFVLVFMVLLTASRFANRGGSTSPPPVPIVVSNAAEPKGPKA